MTKKDLIKINLKLYELTLNFPKKEPLRYKLNEKALDILADYILVGTQNPELDLTKQRKVKNRLLKNVEVLLSFLEIAQPQRNKNWISSENLQQMQQYYSKVEQNIKLEFQKREQQLKRTKDSSDHKEQREKKEKTRAAESILQGIEEETFKEKEMDSSNQSQEEPKVDSVSKKYKKILKEK